MCTASDVYSQWRIVHDIKREQVNAGVYFNDSSILTGARINRAHFDAQQGCAMQSNCFQLICFPCVLGANLNNQALRADLRFPLTFSIKDISKRFSTKFHRSIISNRHVIRVQRRRFLRCRNASVQDRRHSSREHRLFSTIPGTCTSVWFFRDIAKGRSPLYHQFSVATICCQGYQGTCIKMRTASAKVRLNNREIQSESFAGWLGEENKRQLEKNGVGDV